jgi:hypothetical protein
MSKRILLCLFLLATAFRAHATDYTDLWYVPAESGWGANVVQSDSSTQSFVFVTFFIYGADSKPTWFSANLTLDATGNYNGPLYATTGTYYGATWNASTLTRTQVGTASFQPTTPYTANLIYVVTSGPTAITVTKGIQRQTLLPINLAPGNGTYTGGQSGAYSGSSCAGFTYTDTFGLNAAAGLTVIQSAAGAVSFTFNYDGLGATCVLAGTLSQVGQLFQVTNANYQCNTTPALNTTASMSEIKKTAQGIEGKFFAPNVGAGCSENAAFSAVFVQ